MGAQQQAGTSSYSVTVGNIALFEVAAGRGNLENLKCFRILQKRLALETVVLMHKWHMMLTVRI